MIGFDNGSVSQDVAFKILSNPRRRAIIYILRTADEPVTVMQLAELIAGWEEQRPPEDLARSERKRVYVSLYQTHIPELKETGLVEQVDDEVRPTAKLQAVDPYLTTETQSFPWYYVTGAASAGALLFLGIIALLPLYGIASASIVGLIFLGVVTIAATGQVLEARQRFGSIPAELHQERVNQGEPL